ncbi:hypothetical protein SPRG_19209 [Saprolegnia parasitica CBS 223.65]|uniref:Uncharacterized protein n=1 Tax=Saprolegnia parasitica (strain CBS 223.65) TaxID=695850 RepID=A0A067CS98_SAPPC|nr:hypothetical protein SPRG_19209 [Saprolegnia parasitica CBS 223.65]KDO33579.1 hypothetical protein SPRG_19209 [Saprolegnia parasitica CBS 223.65]|eukprot:XP_012195632.1 hypothetical protein SPRG_19209 [Saprolegnia parasitica CBS 223.65]
MVQVPPPALAAVDVAEMELWERESAPAFQYSVRAGNLVKRLTAIQDRSLCTAEKPAVASHGHCVWDAALVLAEYLQGHVQPWRQAVELGAGVGLVGMTLSALGVADVVLTDQAYCLPLLQKNVEFNFSADRRPRVRELQWGAAETDLSPDVVVASDILYNASVFPLLVRTICQLLATPSSVMYMTYETRNAAMEADFIKQLEGQGLHCHGISLEYARYATLVPYPEEICLYRIARSHQVG